MTPAALLAANSARLTYYKNRITGRGLNFNTTAIVIMDVDDTDGANAAEILKPGVDWAEFRARGEAPIARAIVTRSAANGALNTRFPGISAQISAASGVAVVCVSGADFAVTSA